MSINETFPLIERIILVGVGPEELHKFFSQKRILLSELSELRIKILEEYKSNDLNEAPHDNYIENITMVNL